MFGIEFHPHLFIVTPSLVVSFDECETPECDAKHWELSLGWLLFTVFLRTA